MVSCVNLSGILLIKGNYGLLAEQLPLYGYSE